MAKKTTQSPQTAPVNQSELNGKDKRSGRFLPGNKLGAGVGNPQANRTYQLRQLIRDSVTDEDLKSVMQEMVRLAKAGDIQAANLVIDRVVGKAVQAVDISLDDLAGEGVIGFAAAIMESRRLAASE